MNNTTRRQQGIAIAFCHAKDEVEVLYLKFDNLFQKRGFPIRITKRLNLILMAILSIFATNRELANRECSYKAIS